MSDLLKLGILYRDVSLRHVSIPAVYDGVPSAEYPEMYC
jgi:hypothetical protein